MSAWGISDLVGAWSLQRWEVQTRQGMHQPYGDQPRGLLSYTSDGYMQASIAAAGRPLLAGPSPRSAPEDELAASFLSFFAYAGRYELIGDDVVHHVEIALNPAMAGTQQVRHANLRDGALVLSADEELGGGSRRSHRLVWRRAMPFQPSSRAR